MTATAMAPVRALEHWPGIDGLRTIVGGKSRIGARPLGLTPTRTICIQRKPDGGGPPVDADIADVVAQST